MSENNSNNQTSIRKVDAFANTAIWTAAIAWGSLILFILIIALNSFAYSYHIQDFDSLGIPVIYITMLSNLISLLSGIVGLVRSCIKRKESSGIFRAIFAIVLSLALFGITLPALHRA